MAGIFLLVMSLSGSVLVFHDEIDRAFFRDHFELQQPAGSLSFDHSFDKVRKANPGWEIRVPSLPQSGEALKYELRKEKLRKWIFVHPETGEVLGAVSRADKRFVDVLLTLHYSFFAGTPGKIFVLILGLIFLVLLITGTVLYRKSLLKVLLFKQHFSRKSRRALFSSVHRLLGVWGLVLNMAICITGIRIAYVVASAGVNAAPLEVSVPAFTRSIDEMISAAGNTYPEFNVTYVRFPLTAESKLLLLGHLKSDPAYYGKFYSNVAIDHRTGKIEGITLLKDKPPLDKFLTILQPLHFGDYAGIWVKLIYTIGGLLPGILAVSGYVIWRLRKRR